MVKVTGNVIQNVSFQFFANTVMKFTRCQHFPPSFYFRIEQRCVIQPQKRFL